MPSPSSLPPTPQAVRRDFRLLFTGTALNQAGVTIELGALPLLAVYVLEATPMQVGALYASGTIAFLIIGLPAGAWVDRARRRRILQWAGLVHAVLLVSIPAAAWLDLLTFWHLLVIAAAGGTMTVFFDVAAPAYLPTLVGRGELGRYNAKIFSVQALARSSGPALSGALTQFVGAANAVLMSIGAFLGSSGVISQIRTREDRPPREGRHLLKEVWEGIRYVHRDRVLRVTLAAGATFNFFRNIATAVEVLFLARTLGLPPLGVGLLLSLFGIGGAVGALTAPLWFRRVGELRTMWLVLLTTQPLMALVAVAERDWRMVPLVLGLFGVGYGGQVYNVAQMNLRQQVCDDGMLGRMNASCRFVTWSVVPLGVLAGGALGEAFGLRTALWVAAVGGMGAALWPLAARRSATSAPV
ncbi:MFS transporter [Saccharothrix sp. AJ9571]|nr:MFS transporter [Saccharothrix sp. AJ9571]